MKKIILIVLASIGTLSVYAWNSSGYQDTTNRNINRRNTTQPRNQYNQQRNSSTQSYDTITPLNNTPGTTPGNRNQNNNTIKPGNVNPMNNTNQPSSTNPMNNTSQPGNTNPNNTTPAGSQSPGQNNPNQPQPGSK